MGRPLSIVLAFVSLLFAAMWLMSARCQVAWGPQDGRAMITLREGLIHAGVDADGGLPFSGWLFRWQRNPGDPLTYWRWESRSHATGWSVVFPAWAFPAATLALIPFSWRRESSKQIPDILRREGKCVGCGYLRTGLRNTSPCPECGVPSTIPIA